VVLNKKKKEYGKTIHPGTIDRGFTVIPYMVGQPIARCLPTQQEKKHKTKPLIQFSTDIFAR
jgi:hypothetical protein